jgi:DNA invertase Pin-like site-specific DNA recombinase
MRYYGGKMFIRAYLRASTEDQFVDRAKMLEQFVQQRGHKIASYYREISAAQNLIALSWGAY